MSSSFIINHNIPSRVLHSPELEIKANGAVVTLSRSFSSNNSLTVHKQFKVIHSDSTCKVQSVGVFRKLLKDWCNEEFEINHIRTYTM